VLLVDDCWLEPVDLPSPTSSDYRTHGVSLAQLPRSWRRLRSRRGSRGI